MMPLKFTTVRELEMYDMRHAMTNKGSKGPVLPLICLRELRCC
jgi:hypothetical protein